MDARVDFELVIDKVADTLHQPDLLTTAALQQQVDSVCVARTVKTNEKCCASWGESTEDGHYCNPQRILSESTSCSTLLVKDSVMNLPDDQARAAPLLPKTNLMQRMPQKLCTSF